jgi:hypothetical protein
MLVRETNLTLFNSSSYLSNALKERIYFDSEGSIQFNPHKTIKDSLRVVKNHISVDQLNTVPVQGAEPTAAIWTPKKSGKFLLHHGGRTNVGVGGLALSPFQSNFLLTGRPLNGQVGVFLGQKSQDFNFRKETYLVINDAQELCLCKTDDINSLV